jgi:uncharacterized protein YdaL
MVRQVRQYAVYYRTAVRPKGSVIMHVYVNATSPEEALKEAEPLLKKSDAILYADLMPTWEVTKV